METINRVPIKLTTLTPVHISSGEKYKRGSGVFINQRERKTYIVNWDALCNQLPIEELKEIAQLLSCQNIGGINHKLKSFANKTRDVIDVLDYSLYASDYSVQIKNSISQRPLIPGSSIKGAIRTILLWKVLNQRNVIAQWLQNPNRNPSNLERASNEDQHNQSKTYEDLLREFFLKKKFLMKKNDDLASSILGNFENSLTRHFRIPDMEFDSRKWLITKILGRNEDKNNIRLFWKGYNKHSKEYTRSLDFESFTQAWECVDKGCVGYSFWGIEQLNDLYKSLQGRNSVGLLSATWKQLFGNKTGKEFWKQLFQYCNEWMEQYLNNEIDFYNHQASQQAEGIDQIKEQLENLLDKVKELRETNHACILRLGMGSGFHVMSGDWQYQNHLEPLKHLGKIKMKTRKILVSLSLKQNKYQLYLPGFVMIELFEGEIPQHQFTKQKDQEEMKTSQLDQEIQTSPSEPPLYRGKIKLHTQLYAKIVGIQGNQYLVELLAEGYENKSIPMSGYSTYNPLETGTYVKVMVIQITKKGEVTLVRFDELFK